MANSEAPRRPISGTVVAYEAHVRVVGYPAPEEQAESDAPPDRDIDRALAQQLRDDEQLGRDLNLEAQRLFGKAEFSAHVLEITPRASVRVTVTLHAHKQTTVVVEDFRNRVNVFGERVRQVIAAVCTRLHYKVLIDLTSKGSVLAPTPAAKAAAAEKPWDRISAVVAAVATGIGVLGFVAFVGGAIEFGRLEEAGLPAEEALAVIPNANLIAIGAGVLVPALAFALIVAVVLYLWDLLVGFQYRRLAREEAFGEGLYAAGESQTVRQGTWRLLRRALVEPGVRALVFAALFAAAELWWMLRADAEPVDGFWQTIAYLLLVVTTVSVFLVARRSRPFLWVAATAFVGAAIFSSTLAYGQTRAEFKVRPAVALRDGNVIRGFFIAETSSQIYFGRTIIPPPPRSDGEELDAPNENVRPRILILSKDEVNDFVIGRLMDPRKAFFRTRVLAGEICGEADDAPLKLLAKKDPEKRSDCDRRRLNE